MKSSLFVTIYITWVWTNTDVNCNSCFCWQCCYIFKQMLCLSSWLCCPSFSYDLSLLNLLRMMSLRRKQSGSLDMASPLSLSPCRYNFHTQRIVLNCHSGYQDKFPFCGLNNLFYFCFLCSEQESTDYLDRGTTTNFSRKGPSTIAKIKEALNFMRNQQFEVHWAQLSLVMISLYLFLLFKDNLSKIALN